MPCTCQLLWAPARRWLLPSMEPGSCGTLRLGPCRRRPDGKWRRQRAGSKAYAVGGWSAFAVGNMLRFVAMRFAAQTVLSGLGSLQFVIIPIASRVMLGIRASGSTALGVTVVLLGEAPLRACVCVCVFWGWNGAGSSTGPWVRGAAAARAGRPDREGGRKKGGVVGPCTPCMLLLAALPCCYRRPAAHHPTMRPPPPPCLP